MSDQHNPSGAATEQEHPHAHPKNELPHYGKRAYAIRDLLVEKGVVTLDEIQQQIDDLTVAGNARTIKNVELGFLERRRHFVLDHLHPSSAANHIVTVF